MAKFIYNLQNILNLKEKLESQAKNEYAQRQSDLLGEQEKLSEILEKKRMYENKLKNQVSDRLIIVDIMQLNHAIKTMDFHKEEQKKAVQKAERKVEIARAKMNEAMIERKTQEKLKENAFEHFKEELVRVENKENDEFVSFKYNKSDKGV